MSSPQLGLTALSIVTPSIPQGLTTLSVDTSVLALVLNADLNTIAIDVSVGGVTTTLSAFTVVGSQHQFSGSVSVAGIVGLTVVEITGRNYSLTITPTNLFVTPTIQFDLLYTQSNLATLIGPPTGITIYKGQSTCRVEWATPTYPGFEGVRVQWSIDPSGVNSPYVQYGDLVTDLTRSANVTLTTPVTTQKLTQGSTNDTLLTTSSVQTVAVNYSSVTLPYSLINADIFYVILTTVVQDADTNLVYESQASGPFIGGFVNLKKVNPTDFLALQNSNDIVTRMISNLTARRPDLDLTARSEMRDLIFNPLALELSNMSVREWFARCCQSISALAQIDDANGDGVSDPYGTSPVKQQIARAYGLSSTNVQTFIDQRFDILGEGAGVERGGETTAVVTLTFYTYSLPTSVISIPLGIVCSTIPDTTGTASATFITRGSASITPQNAAAFYDPVNQWYGVSVPAEAQTPGSAGNAGAETILQVNSGGPTGISVINLTAADYGLDRQSNADYAAMIQNRQVAGKDTGSRNGYWNTAMSIPGITDAFVVAAGDSDMLRDWSTVISKHTYGCVDIYARGGSSSQQTELLPLMLPATSTYGVYSTYLPLTLLSLNTLSFRVQNFLSLTAPLYAAVELVATSGGNTVWLGVNNVQFDNINGLVFLDPNELTYIVNADGTATPWQLSGVNATNQQFLEAVTSSPVVFSLMAQLKSGIAHTPALQPVTAIDSITGPLTGALPPGSIKLVYTNDFLLTGGSNDAGDLVSVSGTNSVLTTKTLTLATPVTAIDDNMVIGVNAAGAAGNVVSVRSSDLSTVYTFGIDYAIVPTGKYRAYSIEVLPGSAITTGTTQVVVAYYRYQLRETVTLQTDILSLTGSSPIPLLNAGFIHNTWLPVSHGQTALVLDGFASTTLAYTGLLGAGVAPASRYIKVTFNGAVMIEGKDFTLAVDATGGASLTRTLGGAIPSGSPLVVSYYTLEVLSVLTEYPSFVQQLAAAVAVNKHAGADVLIKAQVPSPVDLTFNVVLDSATTPDTVDGRIRTTATLVLNNASKSFNQSQLVGKIQQLDGIASIGLPLLKCAKSDGSYNIGVVIPTGTPWLSLVSDPMFATQAIPANTFISQNALCPEPTIPSGGPVNAYVGFLYEGQAYRRALSVQDLLSSTVPSFYVIGTNDQITAALPLTAPYAGRLLLVSPATVPNPSLLPYRLTYQVFSASSANDVTTSAAEYLLPGSIQINYLSGN